MLAKVAVLGATLIAGIAAAAALSATTAEPTVGTATFTVTYTIPTETETVTQTVTVTDTGTTETTATTPPPPPPPPPPSGYPLGSPYPLGTFWNPGTDARAAPLDPNSAAKIGFFIANSGPQLFNITRWTVATKVASAGDPRVCVGIVKYPAGTTLQNAPIASGTLPDPAGDGHLVIFDFAAGYEYQFWQFSTADALGCPYSAGAAYKLALSARAVPASSVGAYDANFPLMAGVVTPEELARAISQGTDVGHPLIYAANSVTRSSGAPRCPATDNNGSGSSSGLPNGAWIALDPTLNVAALSIPDWQKAIARTLQRYGAYMRDGSGTSTDWSGENTINRDPTAWSRLFGWSSAQTFSSAFPWNRLRVLQPPC